MKSFTKRSLAVMAIILGALSATPLAHAAAHPGSICKATDGNNAVYIGSYSWGIWNTAPSAVSVTCPLIRSTQRENGASFIVYLYHNSAQTTTCFASSNSPLDSNQLAFAQASITTATYGHVSIYLNLVGPGNSNTVSSYSVGCELQGGGRGQLLSISFGEG
jgi:hypothetical protein